MTHPIEKIQDIPDYPTLNCLKADLTVNGCHMCSLGFQPEINGVCVSRGPETANRMIIGEAPGKEEDSTGKPFSGPAGRLMDEIWRSVGMDTNDWYITNVVLCRPYSPRGSGKENFTPKQDQRKKCKIYLDKQIALIKPKLIVTVGAVALEAITGLKSLKMGEWRGRLCNVSGFSAKIFPMLHPAAILHAKGNQELYDMYRQQTWNDIKSLKQMLIQEGIIACQTMI